MSPREAVDPDWAAEAAFVPLRTASRAALLQLSEARGLGFSAPELARIQSYFRRAGREPTDVELAGIAQSWSEHCSYKSSKPFLVRAFRDLRRRPRVLGTGDAGVLRLEKEWAYAVRIESHNHPSAVEPYGGAGTGIGGILRDVLAVGAKPIALTDPLFFGPLELPASALPPGVKSPRYLMRGVVAGIRDYGNRVGVPTVSGGVYFDPAYVVNPLVNVGCVGILPKARLRPNRARARGDRLLLVGGLTGRDGIGGVAFASRELTDRSETESRGAVQLGNPIMKEPLIRGCLEAFDRDLVAGLKDLGGGGVASAFGELVHAGGFGARLHLDRIPLREPNLAPWEIWTSESQERMVLDVRPEDVEETLAIFRRYDVPATDVGEVTSGPYEDLYWNGRPVAHLEIGFRVDPPSLKRKTVHPRPRRRRTPRVPAGDLAGLAESMILAPDSVSREPILRVYDHEVQGRTVVKPLQGCVTSPSHGDATVLRPRPDRWVGLAITTAAQPWSCREDPFQGAIAVVEEAARNLYAVGARPDAFTNCLNFGNPEDPKVLGAFADVVRGLAMGAKALDMMVPSGNVSFYNGGLGAAIPPTPVLMATGILPDLRHAVTTDLKAPGHALMLLGTSAPELGGSLYARQNALAGGPIPPTDPTTVRSLGERLRTAGSRGQVAAAHDIADGGLAVAIAEMAFGGELGFEVDLDATGLPDAGSAMIAEGRSRWIVEVPEERVRRFVAGFPDRAVTRLGRTTADRAGVFRWKGAPTASLDLPALFGRWRAGVGVP